MNKLIVMCGLPGSGKSYHANKYKEQAPDTEIVSSDAIREELWGDANSQQDNKLVFELMLCRTVAALKAGHDVVYDATNLNAKGRKSTLASIRQHVDCEAILVFVACSISECKRRQGMRDRKVPDEVIDRMVRHFEAPWYNEGWNNILVISGGKLQNIDREHWRMLGESHDNPHHTASLEMHCAYAADYMADYLNTPETEHLFSASQKTMLLEAAYQHDLGKHKTKAFVDSKGNPSEVAHYYSHNNVGAYLWLSGDKDVAWDPSEFCFIAVLIQWHMQPFFLRDEDGNYQEALQKWCEKRGFSDYVYIMLSLLHEVDKEAH